MQILNTPPDLRCPSHRYPPHNTGPAIEESCHLFVESHAAEIRSERVYLPIYWTNNYHWQATKICQSGFRPLEAAQRFVDKTIRPDVEYVTVVQNAEGVYERLPANITLLGAGGTGHIPLPLVCKEHPRLQSTRDLTAGFIGAINCGGPLYPTGFAHRSSMNRVAIGSQIRREMIRLFPQNHPAFWLQEHSATSYADTRFFLAVMHRSKYALAPRGYGKTSFRLYEAMQLGAVPVYIYDDPWLPYADVLNWKEFCVLCHFSELSDLPNRLMNLPESWRENACKQLAQLVPDYFSLGGITKQLKRIIESLESK